MGGGGRDDVSMRLWKGTIGSFRIRTELASLVWWYRSMHGPGPLPPRVPASLTAKHSRRRLPTPSSARLLPRALKPSKRGVEPSKSARCLASLQSRKFREHALNLGPRAQESFASAQDGAIWAPVGRIRFVPGGVLHDAGLATRSRGGFERGDHELGEQEVREVVDLHTRRKGVLVCRGQGIRLKKSLVSEGRETVDLHAGSPNTVGPKFTSAPDPPRHIEVVTSCI